MDKNQFTKKQALISVYTRGDFNLFELTAANGQPILITESIQEVIETLVSVPADSDSVAS